MLRNRMAKRHELDQNIQSLFTPAMLADLLKVPVSTIRKWQQARIDQADLACTLSAVFRFQ